MKITVSSAIQNAELIYPEEKSIPTIVYSYEQKSDFYLHEALRLKEYFEINKKTAVALNRARQQGRLIIAVGTTSIRTLEYVAKNEKLKASSGITDLFIREGYKFKFIDGMITNFHVPKSSLMMLVAAFIGRKKLLKLYRYAINQKFRFFSFGDGMLVC